MTARMVHVIAAGRFASESRCPVCGGTFESCTCGQNPGRSVRASTIYAGHSPMSDDLWTALHQHRPTACQSHRMWADQCAAQHGLRSVA